MAVGACSSNTINEIEVHTIFERVGAENGFRLRFQNDRVRLNDSTSVGDGIYQTPPNFAVFTSDCCVRRGGLDSTWTDTVDFVHVFDVRNGSNIRLRVRVTISVNLIGRLRG